jgi:ATP-dependent exoDNAse (exonuclease V) alpha subunit
MIRKNDPDENYVNGTIGYIQKISSHEIEIKCLDEKVVTIKEEEFEVLDEHDEVVASATNFPITLGWATTIHKSQGASIDRLQINLQKLWEYGQAYVALSRAKNPDQLFIEKWNPASFRCHPEVIAFHKRMLKHNEHTS